MSSEKDRKDQKSGNHPERGRNTRGTRKISSLPFLLDTALQSRVEIVPSAAPEFSFINDLERVDNQPPNPGPQKKRKTLIILVGATAFLSNIYLLYLLCTSSSVSLFVPLVVGMWIYATLIFMSAVLASVTGTTIRLGGWSQSLTRWVKNHVASWLPTQSGGGRNGGGRDVGTDNATPTED